MKIKVWEIALLIAVIISVLVGSVSAKQAELTENLIRLHVVANSDSGEDQSLKLAVRDAVLKSLDMLLKDCTEKTGAEKIISENMELILGPSKEVIKKRGKDFSLSARLMVESFPTVKYDTFTLPAGSYTSLRIIIGEGAGKNWWCVVFPPLCLTAAEAPASYKKTGISDETFRIISEDSEEYIVKFKLLELITKLGISMAQDEALLYTAR